MRVRLLHLYRPFRPRATPPLRFFHFSPHYNNNDNNSTPPRTTGPPLSPKDTPSPVSPPPYLLFPDLDPSQFDLHAHVVPYGQFPGWTTPLFRFNHNSLPPLPAIEDPSIRDKIKVTSQLARSLNEYRVEDAEGQVIDYERESSKYFEFIGDNLIHWYAVKAIMKHHEGASRLTIRTVRALLVCNNTLSYLAWTYRIHHGAKSVVVPSFPQQKTIADMFEAYIGAAWLDSKARNEESEVEEWLFQLYDPRHWPDWQDLINGRYEIPKPNLLTLVRRGDERAMERLERGVGRRKKRLAKRYGVIESRPVILKASQTENIEADVPTIGGMPSASISKATKRHASGPDLTAEQAMQEGRRRLEVLFAGTVPSQATSTKVAEKAAKGMMQKKMGFINTPTSPDEQRRQRLENILQYRMPALGRSSYQDRRWGRR